MIRTALFVFAYVSLAACAKPATDGCKASTDAMLDLSFEAFDQGPNGWRTLDGSIACPDAAHEVLAEYRHHHRNTLTPSNTSLLTWHEAQVRAAKGDDQPATARLMREAAYAGEPDWQRLYREGSIAFIEGDRGRLITARAELASLPRDPTLTGLNGNGIDWPPNLDVLDGLISCFGRPYSVAYACRPAPAASPG